VIDGIDQGSFFCGTQEKSNREGCLIWVGERLHGVKWRNFKALFAKQRYFFDGVQQLGTPQIVNLIADPKEREPVDAQYLHTWVLGPVARLLQKYQESVKREPLIPAGAPVGFVPRPQSPDRSSSASAG
jgi:arylsulfatase